MNTSTLNNPILYWAHMLDESFDKRSEREKAEQTNPLPKDENTKFKIGDVFTDDVLNEKDGVKKIFDAIWPEWYDYFEDKIDKCERLEVNGLQRDVDDWDVWEINVEDCWISVENMADLMMEHVADEWNENEVATLKEIIDCEIAKFCESAPDECDIDTLERKGTRIYKGTRHSGGYYPG